jgi:hypothetical protein
VSCLFSTALTATLAELASAYPVSGAMSSWAWKLARGGVGRERGWGWLMGGVVLGGHLGNVLMVTWQICKIIAGVMEMSSDYELQKWQMVCFFLVSHSEFVLKLTSGYHTGLWDSRRHCMGTLSPILVICRSVLFGSIPDIECLTLGVHRSVS